MEKNEPQNWKNAIKQSLLAMAAFSPMVIASTLRAAGETRESIQEQFMTAWKSNPQNMRDPRACDAAQAMAMLLPAGTSLISYASGYSPACQVADDAFRQQVIPAIRNPIIQATRSF